MTVVIATSLNPHDLLAAKTSHHHQNMPQTTTPSQSVSVNGARRRSTATSTGNRQVEANIQERNVLSSTSVPNASKAQPPILRLATEELLTILDFLWDEPQKSITFDRRAYLSQESFRLPPPPSATRAQDLSNWRRTCKKFSIVGASLQFQRVSTRFSVHDLDRLDNIASWPHLATEVRKFIYLVPYFYPDGMYSESIYRLTELTFVQDAIGSKTYFLA
jgi:hypothetical protein